MDRRTERRVSLLKRWRTPRAAELGIDPGILCPNAGLEAIAWANPQHASDLRNVPELRRWFVGEFSEEVVAALAEEAKAPREGGASRRRRQNDDQ